MGPKDDIFGEKRINYESQSNKTRNYILLIVIFCVSIQAYLAFLPPATGIFLPVINAVAFAASSLSISILASFYYARFENKDIKNVLKKIETSGPDGLVSNTLREFRGFNGGYMTDYKNYITIRREKKDGKFLIVTFEVEYNKKVSSKTLNFHFDMLKERPMNDIETPFSDPRKQKYIQNEMYLKFDDEELCRCYGETNIRGFYSVKELVVNGKSVALHKKGTVFTAKIDEEIDNPISIKYKYTAPIEFDSYISVIPGLPCKDTKVKLNIEHIKDEIEVSAIQVLAGYSGPIRLGDDQENGIIERSHTGWVVPESGYIFVWWKKN